MSEQQIEQEIQAKGLTAPRVTPDHVEACIVKEQYHVFEGTTVTVCLLHLPNGFTVDGISACASPENFDPEIGRKIARQNAREKIWALEGYLLKQRLHDAELLRSRPAEECCCHPCLSGEGVCNYERGGALFMGGLTSDGTIEPLAE